jgi:hypothetical protein
VCFFHHTYQSLDNTLHARGMWWCVLVIVHRTCLGEVHKTKKKTSEEEQKGLALLGSSCYKALTLNLVTGALTLLHRMGKATNKSATWKRVYWSWHENPCEAALGIYASPRLDCARDESLDTKEITKHHCTKEKKHTHKAPSMLSLAFFASFLFLLFFFLLFFIFFQGTSKLNSKTKMLLMGNLPHTLSLSWKYDLLKHKRKVYSANKVYITTSSGVCQAQTRIQSQCVLRINHKSGVLGFQHNVYLDSSTMCTRIGAQGCN